MQPSWLGFGVQEHTVSMVPGPPQQLLPPRDRRQFIHVSIDFGNVSSLRFGYQEINVPQIAEVVPFTGSWVDIQAIDSQGSFIPFEQYGPAINYALYGNTGVNTQLKILEGYGGIAPTPDWLDGIHPDCTNVRCWHGRSPNLVRQWKVLPENVQRFAIKPIGMGVDTGVRLVVGNPSGPDFIVREPSTEIAFWSYAEYGDIIQQEFWAVRQNPNTFQTIATELYIPG